MIQLEFLPSRSVSRWRNPQLQVRANYSDLMEVSDFNIMLVNATFY